MSVFRKLFKSSKKAPDTFLTVVIWNHLGTHFAILNEPGWINGSYLCSFAKRNSQIFAKNMHFFEFQALVKCSANWKYPGFTKKIFFVLKPKIYEKISKKHDPQKGLFWWWWWGKIMKVFWVDYHLKMRWLIYFLYQG